MPSAWIEPRGNGWITRWDFGPPPRSRYFTIHRYAVDLRNEKKKEIQAAKAGQPPPKPKAPEVTVAQFIDLFLRHSRAQNRRNTHSNFHGPTLERLKAAFADRLLRSLAPHELEDWRLELLGPLGPATVAMDVRNVRTAFNWAVGMRYLDDNPAKDLKEPRVESPARVLTPSELAALIAGADPWFKAILRVLATTGMRAGEVCALDWRQISRFDGVLEAYFSEEQTKNKRPKYVQFGPDAEAALGKPRESGPVFRAPRSREGVVGVPRATFSHAFNRARERSGIKGRLRAHDLKHTFCTRWMEQNGDISGLSKITGNTIASLQIYDHSKRARKQDVLSLKILEVPHTGPTNTKPAS